MNQGTGEILRQWNLNRQRDLRDRSRNSERISSKWVNERHVLLQLNKFRYLKDAPTVLRQRGSTLIEILTQPPILHKSLSDMTILFYGL